MVSPDEFREDLDKVLTYVSKYRKPKVDFKASLYYNVNMDEDKGKAKEESADFLQKYYREESVGNSGSLGGFWKQNGRHEEARSIHCRRSSGL